MTIATRTRHHLGGPVRPGRAVTILAVSQVRRGALLVGVVVAGMTALVASQYQNTLAGSADLLSLQTLAENPAVSVLFGPPRALDDTGGFTVWRTGTPVAVLVAAWMTASSTRVTRGEEDAGRWALLLAGPSTLKGIVTQHLMVLFALLALLATLVTTVLLACGTRAGGAAIHGVGVGLVGGFFAALGVLAGQALPDRRSAAAATSGFLVGALLLRMAADAADALSWLAWFSPFGLLGRSRAYSGDDPLPLAMLVGYVVALSLAGAQAARRRDVDAGLVVLGDSRPPRSRLLTSLPAFAVRRTIRPLALWGIGVTVYFLVIGLLANSLTQFLTQNPQVAERAAQAGFTGLGTVEGYAASLFTILAVPIGLFAAGRIAADAADEDAGRLRQLLALPVSRQRWLLAHAGVILGSCVVLAVGAGLATWLGAAAVSAPLSLGDSLAGALNALPVAALGLGAGTLALGLARDHVVLAGSLPLVGGFLLLVFADSFGWSTVRELSPFAHVSPVPATGADPLSAGLVLAVALVAVLAGTLAFGRRDLAT